MDKYTLPVGEQLKVLNEQLAQLRTSVFREELHIREATAAIEKAKEAAKINPKMQSYITEKQQVINSSEFMIGEAKDKIDVINNFLEELNASGSNSTV